MYVQLESHALTHRVCICESACSADAHALLLFSTCCMCVYNTLLCVVLVYGLSSWHCMDLSFHHSCVICLSHDILQVALFSFLVLISLLKIEVIVVFKPGCFPFLVFVV